MPIDPAAGRSGEEACRQTKKKRKSGWGAGSGAVRSKGGGLDWGSMTRVRVAAEFEVRVNGVLLEQRFHWDTGVSLLLVLLLALLRSLRCASTGCCWTSASTGTQVLV